MKLNSKYDVIVVGGGPSGIIAAMASAKVGAKTLLIEKNGFLGGAATASVLGPISPFHFGDEQVIDGVPQEFVDELVRQNGSTGHMKAVDPYGSGDYLGFYDREKYKYVAADMLIKLGVDILYHSFVKEVKKQGERVTGIVTISKSNSYSVDCNICVDATGDGDVAVMAGAEYVYGDADTGLAQPSSSMFEMVDVDNEKLYDYIVNNPQEFEWKSDIVPMREFSDRFNQHFFVAQGFNSLVKKAVEAGELSFGRDTVLLLNGIHPNSIHFNSTRVGGYNQTNTLEKSASEIDGRCQIESVSEFAIKYMPGFEKAYVSVTNSEIGVRETRHIVGLYTLTEEDGAEGRKFDDVVSRGYFPMDVHNPYGAAGYGEKGKGGLWIPLKDTYDIPYRCFVPKKLDGLVLCGRCISGTSTVHGSYRTQGGIMGIGQAAGTAAALAAMGNVEPRALDIKVLQSKLLELGASLRRNEEKKASEEATVKLKVRSYMGKRKNNITKPEVLAKFMGD